MISYAKIHTFSGIPDLPKTFAGNKRGGRVTQDELANLLGSTQSFVSKCERGERRLDVVELKSWCQALHFSIQVFVSRLEEANK